MGELRPESWYDDESKALEKREYLTAYNPPWPRMARWPARMSHICSKIDMDRPVLDIGCGPGFLAAYLWHYGHKSTYSGVDWSTHTLHRATGGNNTVFKSGHQHAKFWKIDLGLVTISQIEDITGGTLPKPTIVMGEVLEHLEDDVRLVESIPSGRSVVLTVPRFDDPSHVRFFDKPKEVLERFESIDFEGCHVIMRNWILGYGESQ